MNIIRTAILALALAAACSSAAQESTNTGVQRRQARNSRTENTTPGVTDRMQSHFSTDDDTRNIDAERAWMRVIYRQLDYDTDPNTPLYFPQDPVDGQENLFRIIMRLLADGKINAYEYLDGRELFTDNYKVKVRDVLDRFYIPYSQAKGSTEKNPRFTIDPSDVPTSEVLSYYIIERWEYDTRGNRMRTSVEAICPVLHRSGDFGGDAVKYPMFWIKLADIRPYLAQQQIFTSDDNNLPTCTYDDFFNLALYKGDIYKTRNLRNRSMMQLYPDPDDLRRAQDSIQNRLDRFEDKLWVPDREVIIAEHEARLAAASGDSTAVNNAAAAADKPKARSTKRSTKRSEGKPKEVKEKKPKQIKSSSSSTATRSVRRSRKR